MSGFTMTGKGNCKIGPEGIVSCDHRPVKNGNFVDDGSSVRAYLNKCRLMKSPMPRDKIFEDYFHKWFAEEKGLKVIFDDDGKTPMKIVTVDPKED